MLGRTTPERVRRGSAARPDNGGWAGDPVVITSSSAYIEWRMPSSRLVPFVERRAILERLHAGLGHIRATRSQIG